MKLYASVIFIVLAFLAIKLVERYAHKLGRETAYAVELSRCKQEYPHFRCVVELAREFKDVQQ